MQEHTIYFIDNFGIKYMYFIKYFRIFIQLFIVTIILSTKTAAINKRKQSFYIMFYYYTKSKI